MLRPKVPAMPQPTGHITPPTRLVEPTTVIQQSPQHFAPGPATAPASVPARPAVQLTPGSVIALVGGGAAVVLVVGAVLVSLLLAVAVTAASVAVCALVIRSLVASDNRRR
ncbi:SpdD-like protein [Streptomyces sp. NPDC002698]|uniref:SpdD-like protein n=1 Tax=Streptomyces sp. NPDC002698 TaxID=3364660 RepID=UPI00369147D5